MAISLERRRKHYKVDEGRAAIIEDKVSEGHIRADMPLYAARNIFAKNI